MKISVIIPAFNEEKRLPLTLDDMAAFLKTFEYEVEVIVVDDGSKDKTAEVAEQMKDKINNLHILRSETNHGKGYAVRKGMQSATGELLLFMDADNSSPLSEISKLLPYSREYEVVIGSRHLTAESVTIKQPWYRILLSRWGNKLIQALVVKGVIDTQCGFKLFERTAGQEIFRRQVINGFGFDMELLAIAQKILGYHIKEVPITWHDTPGSHIRPLRDAWKIFRELLLIRKNLFKGVYHK